MKDVDQSGVDVDTKKVIAIESAPIIVIEEKVVDVGIDIASVLVADIAVFVDISMLNGLAVFATDRMPSKRKGSVAEPVKPC